MGIGADIDPQELDAAIAKLAEGRAGADQEIIYYRNIFEVAREERRKMYDKWSESHKTSPATIDWRTWQPPMFQVDDADMKSFEDALQSWRDRSGQNNA
jgi:hypothetical protein